MKRRRRLSDRFTLPAGEPFANRLDHLPLTRDNLERLGDILAELRQLGRAAARAALRRWDHGALTRQMIRERFSRRPLAPKDLTVVEGFVCSAASSSSAASASASSS